MPTYNFYCEKCKAKFDLECRISEYDQIFKNIDCPNCSSTDSIYRDYNADNIYSTIREIRTVGQLAEHNTKKMGSKLTEEYAKKKEAEPQKPWYHNPKLGGATRKEINKMTIEQKRKYILKGQK